MVKPANDSLSSHTFASAASETRKPANKATTGVKVGATGTTTGTFSKTTTPGSRSGTASEASTGASKARLEALAKTMEFKWFISHILVVLSTILMLLLSFYPKASRFFYRTGFISAFSGFAIILFQKYGKSKPTLSVLVRDTNFQYAVFTFIWLFLVPRILALFPLAIFSLFHFLTYMRSYLLPAIGHASTSPLVQRIDAMVKNFNEPLTVLAANFELTLAVQLLLAAFTFGRGAWLQLLLYTTFFRLRYSTSAYTRHAVKVWEVRVDQLLSHSSFPPAVKQFWAQTKSYLARIPGPVNSQ